MNPTAARERKNRRDERIGVPLTTVCALNPAPVTVRRPHSLTSKPGGNSGLDFTPRQARTTLSSRPKTHRHHTSLLPRFGAADRRREADDPFLLSLLPGCFSAPLPPPNNRLSLVESGTAFFFSARASFAAVPPPHQDATAPRIPPAPDFPFLAGGGSHDPACSLQVRVAGIATRAAYCFRRKRQRSLPQSRRDDRT